MTSRIVRHPGGETLSEADIEAAHLIVVTDTVSQQNIAALRRYLESGHPLLLVMRSAETAPPCRVWRASTDRGAEAEVGRYAMLDRSTSSTRC